MTTTTSYPLKFVLCVQLAIYELMKQDSFSTENYGNVITVKTLKYCDCKKIDKSYNNYKLEWILYKYFYDN